MTIETADLPFGTQLIGRTEKSLGVLLDRVLADSGLNEPEYVAMRVCSDQAGSQRAAIEARLAAVFRKGNDHASALLDSLASAKVIESDASGSVQLTASGRSLRDGIALETDAITARLWGDLPAQDLDVAARVLSTVLHRAALEHA